MKVITLVLYLFFATLSIPSFSQVTISTEYGEDILLQAMEEANTIEGDWVKAMEIVKPRSYKDYCSFYISECQVTEATFKSYMSQISSITVRPISKIHLRYENSNYLLFVMHFDAIGKETQRVPLLTLKMNDGLKLLPQEVEQKLYSTKALITLLDHETFLQKAPEVFGKDQKILELELYDHLMDEAAKQEVEQGSIFNLPPINSEKRLPIEYQGKMVTTYSTGEYQRAERLMQRGFTQEANKILLSKMTAEELNKMIKDEARN